MKLLLLRLLTALLLALLAFAAGLYFGQGRQATAMPAPPPAATQELLHLALPGMDGTPVPLARWDGQVRVINYWATWCPPCRQEMPAFSRLQKEMGERGVQFVGIAVDTGDNVREFSGQHPVNYPLLIATPQALENLHRLGNPQGALPFTLIIDRQGTVHQTRLGGLNGEELAAILQPLL